MRLLLEITGHRLSATKLITAPAYMESTNTMELVRKAATTFAWQTFNKPGVYPSALVDVKIEMFSYMGRSKRHITAPVTLSIGKDGTIRQMAERIGDFAADNFSAVLSYA